MEEKVVGGTHAHMQVTAQTGRETPLRQSRQRCCDTLLQRVQFQTANARWGDTRSRKVRFQIRSKIKRKTDKDMKKGESWSDKDQAKARL